MIILNRFVRTYLLESKVATIQNKSFQCCVSTAKEGLFQKQSTIILEPKIGNTIGAGPEGLRPCGKVIYSTSLRKGDRFQFHDGITKTLDALGEEGCTLEEALETIYTDLKRRGIAMETINLAADQGQADAQFNPGGPYINGKGDSQDDFTQPITWYRKAAEQGDVDMQFSLGYLYCHGLGVPQDYAQASFWYRKAAEQGNTSAQFMLGDLYYNGLSMPQDYAQASFWYRKAAEQGNADAQYGLGYLYCMGLGKPHDYKQAVEWWRKAAEQGNALAQSSLGGLYQDGVGVTKDYAEAYFWLDIAAAGKLSDSLAEQTAKHRDEVASHLMPAELSRLQERVREWFFGA
jgi:TPR repeat protein